MVWCCDNLCREACAEKRRKAEHAARIAGNFLRTDHAGADRGEHAGLGRSIGSPLRASLVSFSVGLIAMLTLTLLLGPYPLIPATAANGPWWMWFAGVFGVTFLTGNVLLLPKLGSLKTVIMPVTGQIVMGLLIDAFGWFGTTAQPISPLRIAGAAITLVGFLLAVAGPNLRLRPAIDRPAGGSENSGRFRKIRN